jgi:spermidine/putrescine transport system substrate-binding protein
MKRMTSTIALAAALLASASFAHAEGELNIYNWGNYTSPEMIKKFEDTVQGQGDDHRLRFQRHRACQGSPGRLRLRHRRPLAELHSDLDPEGLLLETDPGKMENFKNVAKEWANPDFDPGRKYTVPWAMGIVGTVVNTDVYKGDINTWGIIFDTPDELKGKVNVVPEMTDVIDAAVLYNGGKKCTGDLAILKKVRDTLVKAKPNWVAMEYGTIEKMGSGDFAASSDWNGSAFRQRLKNPAIKFGYPKEGFVDWSDNLSVLKDAKNVENAKLFQNFMMDPENAGMNSGFHRYANGIAGSDKFMPADMKGAPEINVPAEFASVGVPSMTCPPDVQALYTKIWTELQK